MERKQALIDLRDKVKAGEESAYADDFLQLVRAWRSPAEYFEVTNYVHRAYRGSLDAAKALHEAVLPGFFVEIKHWSMHEPMSLVTVGNDFKGESETIACAWLLAILEALIAQEEQDQS